LQPLLDGEATATHVTAIAAGLRAKGWEVDVVSPLRSRSPSVLRRGLAWLTATAGTLRALRRDDVLYLRTHVASLALAEVARWRGNAVVQELNGTWSEVSLVRPWLRPVAFLARWSFARQCARSAFVIAVTPELGSQAEAHGARRVAVIPNGADVTRFRPDVPAPPDAPPSPFVLFFGALSPWQGVEHLLAAVRHEDWPKGVPLVILGAGALQERVEDEARRSPMIVFGGHVPHDVMPGWVAAARAVTILKHGAISTTGFSPLKLYESMAAGTPTIVSDVPGLAETVRLHHCGIVVDPADAKAVANAVSLVAADASAAAAMGAAGREAAVRCHSWEAAATATDVFIRDGLART
jgi:glycosyltransferase involved in cell wall biosynthesis